MAYISKIAVERALRSLEEAPTEAIRFHLATEAAHVLLATSRRHARRFALAMHSRVARGLDAALIEHWARVVMEISRLYTDATDNGVACPLRPRSFNCIRR
jgi:hypothetical protein